MAVSRDNAARVLRQESVDRPIDRPAERPAEPIQGEAATDNSAASPAALAGQLRSHVAEESKRRTADAPETPATEKPAQNAPAPGAPPASAAAPKSRKRRFVLMGIVLLLAIAAASYGGYYTLVGRFYVSTDDAYVRANNTMLGARVAGHISSILPGDNTLVHAGNVVFRIDDGDYKIAVDAAATRIATQQATIDRIGRQVAALESQVVQAKAQLVSAEAGLTTVPRTRTDRRYVLDTMSGGGVALLDCDNDGKLDIAVVNDSTIDQYVKGGDPVITLTLNDPMAWTMDSLNLSWDVSRPTSVIARQALFNDSDPGGASGDSSDSGLSLLDAQGLSDFSGKTMTVMLTAPVDDAQELTLRAQALLQEAGWFVRCEGEVDVSRLNAILRVGTVVQVNGAGALNSGKYFVWSVRHSITADSHKMKCVLVRNAVGPPPSGGGLGSILGAVGL